MLVMTPHYTGKQRAYNFGLFKTETCCIPNIHPSKAFECSNYLITRIKLKLSFDLIVTG